MTIVDVHHQRSFFILINGCNCSGSCGGGDAREDMGFNIVRQTEIKQR